MRIAAALFAVTALSLTVPVSGQDARTEQVSEPSESQADIAARVAAVQRHVDAYRSRNLERFVASFAPDAVVQAEGFTAVGRNQIRELYRLNFAPGAPGIRIRESGVVADRVFLSVSYVTGSGEEVCCSYSEYEVRDGKISYLYSARE